MSTNIHIDVHGSTNRGRRHRRNHDRFAIATLNKSMRIHQTNLSLEDDARVHGDNQGYLFVVADGVGGAPAPAVASGTAVHSVVEYFLNEMPWYHVNDDDPRTVTRALKQALQSCQEDIFRRGLGEREGMGSTMTLAFVFWPNLYLAHVGDSRCYLSRAGDLERLTTDHTMAQVRRDLGGNASQGDENVLWNALGGGASALQAELTYLKLLPGDVLALTTDGVCSRVDESKLRSVLSRAESAQGACDKLLRNDGADDRTAVVVRFLEPEEHEATVASQGTAPGPLEAEHPVPAPRVPETPARREDPQPAWAGSAPRRGLLARVAPALEPETNREDTAE